MSRDAPEWLCQIDGRQIGPLSSIQVRKLIRAGTLEPHHQIRRANEDEWQPAGAFDDLFGGSDSSSVPPLGESAKRLKKTQRRERLTGIAILLLLLFVGLPAAVILYLNPAVHEYVQTIGTQEEVIAPALATIRDPEGTREDVERAEEELVAYGRRSIPFLYDLIQENPDDAEDLEGPATRAYSVLIELSEVGYVFAVRRLNHTDPDVRYAAARVIGRLAEDDGEDRVYRLTPVVPLLLDPYEKVRRRARYEIGEGRYRGGFPSNPEFAEFVANHLVEHGLTNTDPAIRSSALIYLSGLAETVDLSTHAGTAESLLEDSPNFEVKRTAAAFLSSLGGNEVLEYALDDSNEDVQSAAALAATDRVSSKSEGDTLTAVFARILENSEQYRAPHWKPEGTEGADVKTVRALGRLADTNDAALSVLVDTATTHPRDDIQRAAIGQLRFRAEDHYDVCTTALLDALKDENAITRRSASWSLVHIEPFQLEWIVAIGDSIDAESMETLGKNEALKSQIMNASVEDRQAAAEALSTWLGSLEGTDEVPVHFKRGALECAELLGLCQPTGKAAVIYWTFQLPVASSTQERMECAYGLRALVEEFPEALEVLQAERDNSALHGEYREFLDSLIGSFRTEDAP